jgi:hypothetical protein
LPQAPPTRSRSLAFSGFGQANVFSRFRGDPASSGPSERSNGCNPLKGREMMTEDLAGPVRHPRPQTWQAHARGGPQAWQAHARGGRRPVIPPAWAGPHSWQAHGRAATCVTPGAGWAGSRASMLYGLVHARLNCQKSRPTCGRAGRGGGWWWRWWWPRGVGGLCTTISTSAPAQPLRTRTHTRRGSPSPTHATARTQPRELEAVPNATSHPAKPSKVTNQD